METTESPESTVNREEKEEKKGGGLFANFLNKLGLGGAAGEGAGVSVGTSAIGAAEGGGLAGGGILATKAGVVALIVAGTTVAAGIGVVGRNALSGKSGGVTDGIYSLFPGKSGSSAPATAGSAASPSAEVSSSLDYMSQAAKNDPMMKEQAASAEAGAVPAASADAMAPGQVKAPDNANKPANVGSASPAGKLTKMAGFSSGGSGGSGGSFSGHAPGADAGRSMNASRMGPALAMSRGMTSAGSSNRALVGARGQRAGDQLKFANMDGMRANGMRNPTMSAAGRTFDGATPGGMQSSPAGGPSASMDGGIADGSRDRFVPNKVLDQRDLPQPKKPDAGQDATPYKTQMWIATGALVVAMALMMFAGKVKDKAKAMPALTPVDAAAKAAELHMAAMLHLAAAAAAAVALAMGVIIMTAYGQTMQGLLFAGIGGILAGWNAYNAYNLYSEDPEAKRAEEMKSAQQTLTGEQNKLGGLQQGTDAYKAQQTVVQNATAKVNSFFGQPPGGLANGTPDTALELGKTYPTTDGKLFTLTDKGWVPPVPPH